MELNRLCTALGEEQLEFEADGRRTFTIEEMQQLENALAAQGVDPERVETLQGILTQAESERDRLSSILSERDQLIETLNAQVAERDEQIQNLLNTPPTVSDPVAETDSIYSGEDMLTADDINLFNKIKG